MMRPTERDKVLLTDALLELDEARATEQDIQNVFAYGTDDPKLVAKLEDQMRIDWLMMLYDIENEERKDSWDSGFDLEEDDYPPDAWEEWRDEGYDL